MRAKENLIKWAHRDTASEGGSAGMLGGLLLVMLRTLLSPFQQPFHLHIRQTLVRCGWRNWLAFCWCAQHCWVCGREEEEAAERHWHGNSLNGLAGAGEKQQQSGNAHGEDEQGKRANGEDCTTGLWGMAAVGDWHFDDGTKTNTTAGGQKTWKGGQKVNLGGDWGLADKLARTGRKDAKLGRT